jgi:hypothetical protein
VAVSAPLRNPEGSLSPQIPGQRVVHPHHSPVAQRLLAPRVGADVSSTALHPPELSLGVGRHPVRDSAAEDRVVGSDRVETLFLDKFSAGLSPEAFQTLSQAWKQATKSHYEYAWRRWCQYCREQVSVIDPDCPSVSQLINYLQSILTNKDNPKYSLRPSTVASRKSALLTLMNADTACSIRSSVQFHKYMQGMFKAHPKVVGAAIWDASIVLTKLSVYAFPHSSLYFLGRHIAVLIQLLGGRRVHDLSLLTIHPSHLLFVEDQVWLQPVFGSKTDRFAKIQGPMKFVNGESELLSLPILIRKYLELTKGVRGECQALLVSPQVPTEPASIQKIRSWIKSFLEETGIAGGTPGSTRAAVATAGLLQGQTVEQVLERGNWASARTLFGHYFRPQ